MTPRFIDWIWHVRGSLALPPEHSGKDAFDRLEPLFGQAGTSHERSEDRLVFHKKDQAAQDRMAVFDGGVLRIERDGPAPRLRYDLSSRALLACFLAPLLFLAFGQLTVFTGRWHETPAQEQKTKGKDARAGKAEVPMNPIDKALGAPEPDKDGKEKAEGRDKKPSPTPAYVFAAIFATLYLAGRILEDRLVRTLFRKHLLSA